jgi:hypothetical protein
VYQYTIWTVFDNGQDASDKDREETAKLIKVAMT